MKKYALFIGIDVSKSKLDIVGITSEHDLEVSHKIISNKPHVIKAFFFKLLKSIEIRSVLVGFENTGVYSAPTARVLNELGIDYSQVPSLEISRSRGLKRGKSDKIDAKEIAEYLSAHQHRIKLSTIQSDFIGELKLLFSQREKIIKAVKQFEMNSELQEFIPKKQQKVFSSTSKKIIKMLHNNQKVIEKRMEEILNEEKQLAQQFQLIQSVPGVGRMTAIYLIIVTEGFSKFESAKQLACHAGVAPFPFESGSSIKGRTKVNHLANKKLKSLLNMCALCAKKHDTEIRIYFQRKVDEGKNKMLVMNNIRNKLIHRVFAVIKRQTPYVNMKKFAA